LLPPHRAANATAKFPPPSCHRRVAATAAPPPSCRRHRHSRRAAAPPSCCRSRHHPAELAPQRFCCRRRTAAAKLPLFLVEKNDGLAGCGLWGLQVQILAILSNDPCNLENTKILWSRLWYSLLIYSTDHGYNSYAEFQLGWQNSINY
jgi:hypothetical protein